MRVFCYFLLLSYLLMTSRVAIGQSKIHALIIGISNYQHFDDLSYAHKDAMRFKSYLEQAAPKANIKLITNEQALHDSIELALLDLLVEANPEDTVFFYFSGHGDCETRFQGEPGYLLTHNTPGSHYQLASLPLTKLKWYLDNYGSEKDLEFILIVDACRAGQLATVQQGPERTANALLHIFNQRLVFLSCHPEEISLESPEYESGLFTYFLSKGLAGEADQNRDGKLVAEELGRYVQDSVKHKSGQQQTPIHAGDARKALIMIPEWQAPQVRKKPRFRRPATPATPKPMEMQAPAPAPITSFAPNGGFTLTPLEILQRFNAALKAGRLHQPDSNNAIFYYQLYHRTQGHDPKTKQKMKIRVHNGLKKSSTDLLLLFTSNENLAVSEDDKYSAIADLEAGLRLLAREDPLYGDFKSRSLFFQALVDSNGTNELAAIDLLEEAALIDPTAAYIHFQLGVCLAHLGQTIEAVEALQLAGNLAPAWQKPYDYLQEGWSSGTSLVSGLASYNMDRTAIEGPTKTYMRGIDYIENQKFEKALRRFARVRKALPKIKSTHATLALTYYLLKDYKAAIPHYAKFFDAYPNLSRYLYFEAAEVAQKAGLYEKAINYYTTFRALHQDQNLDFSFDDAYYFDQATLEQIRQEHKFSKRGLNWIVLRELLFIRESLGLRGNTQQQMALLPTSASRTIECQQLLDVQHYQNLASAAPVRGGINAKRHELGPSISKDGQQLYYSSVSSDLPTNKEDGLDVYFLRAELMDRKWSDPVTLTSVLGTEDGNAFSFTGNERSAYFIAKDEQLGVIKEWRMDNSGLMTDTEKPMLSAQLGEMRDVASNCDASQLIFSSDRPGGYGGFDLWMVERLSDGSWSIPVNLGKEVNSKDDERTPYLALDGQSLYFSSDRMGSLGGLDVYLSKWDKTRLSWTVAANLGKGINTTYDELHFSLAADRKQAYYSSNRRGGAGGYDIYHLELVDQLKSENMILLAGVVRDSLTGIPIPTTLRISKRGAVASDENGKYLICLPANETVTLQIDEGGYRPYRQKFGYDFDFLHHDIRLQPSAPFAIPAHPIPKPTELVTLTHTIKFAPNSSEIPADQIIALENFQQGLSSKDLQLVEVVGYAKNTGSDNYNATLAEERAIKVAQLLQQKGIKVDIIYVQTPSSNIDESPESLGLQIKIQVLIEEER